MKGFWSIEELHVGGLQSLQVRFKDLPDVDGVIAGPSCVPFSQTGRREQFEDHRSNTFSWSVGSILDQASRGTKMRFFILENVTGIAKRKRGADESAKDEILSYLREQLGETFSIWSWQVHSRMCGSPQVRVRWFICGRRTSCFEDPAPEIEPADVYINSGLTLEKILEVGLPDQQDSLTPKMRKNLDWYVNQVQQEQVPDGTVVVCDLSRADGCVIKPMYRYDGTVMTLTCTNRHLWVFKAGANQDLNRWLSDSERAILQGFCPCILRNLPSDFAWKAVGNAMTVPAIGVVFACLYRGLKDEYLEVSS